MSPLKELHYWDWRYRPDLCGGFDRRYRRRLRELGDDHRMAEILRDRIAMAADETAYMRYFEKRVGDAARVFGEITPSYSLLPREGFEKLRNQHPDVRIVLLLRDPVARLWSAICASARSKGFSPEDRWRSQLDMPGHLERSRYDLLLKRLDAVFRPEEVLVEFYESLFSNEAMERLASFLEIGPFRANFDIRVNTFGKPPLAEEFEDRARQMLAPVYDYCARRFGAALPAAWRRTEVI